MNIADIIIYGCLLFYFVRGFSNGILRTLLSPIALIVGTVLSYIYYQQTHDFLKSLMLSVLGPFLVSIILGIILRIYENTGKKKGAIGPISRFGGGLLALSWSGLWFILLVLLVTMLPIPKLQSVQKVILASYFYSRVNDLIGDKLPGSSPLGVEKISEVLEDPERLESLKETPEYDELMNEESLQTVLSDKKTMDQIQKKDVAQLLQNPKFQAVLQDKDILKKVMALHAKLMEMEKDPESTSTSPEKQEVE